MNYATNAAVNAATTSAVAQQAAVAQALRASGVICRMEPSEFLHMVALNDEPLVVHAYHKGMFSKYHQYLTSFRGLAFYAKTDAPLQLPEHALTVTAEGIWIP